MLLQASLEFFVLVSLLLVILIVVMYFNSSYYYQFNLQRIYSEANKISENIASEINLALKAGDGYSRVFYIPGKILDSIDFDIKVSNFRVYVYWDNNFSQSVIYTKEVIGTFKNGENWIRNINGEIYVN